MLEFQHLRGFQGLNYSLKFAESLTLDKLKTWYYGTIRRERKREKRERNERDKREPVSLPPSPLTLYGERKERVKKERRERKREYPHLGKNSAGDVYARCVQTLRREGRTGGEPCVNVYLLFNGNNLTAYIFIKQPYAGYIM